MYIGLEIMVPVGAALRFSQRFQNDVHGLEVIRVDAV